MELFLRNISLALEGVIANKFRAFLTALGIVFGVAAVIAMMAIGKGAQRSILEQLEQIGTNNIMVSAITPEQQAESAEEESDDKTEKKKFSKGLHLSDVLSVQSIVPNVKNISPELMVKDRITHSGITGQGICLGVWNDYFDIFNLNLKEGKLFTTHHMENGSAVCVVGADIQKKYFQNSSPLGKRIKCGKEWLTVIGVLDRKATGNLATTAVTVENQNSLVFVPVRTAIQRLENRSRIDRKDIGRGRRRGPAKNYHQLDRMLIKVADPSSLRSTADIIKRAVIRRHNGLEDVSFDIPELLIKQRQNTQQTLNFVLAIIAGISLLVGGIGIMNIMLASVMERIKEIGIRRSVGAGQKDIIFQFLLEAMLISLLGGVVGIGLGLLAAELIAGSAEITTAVDGWSILLSFGVAVGVGLLFGYLPARKAATQDPVSALRTD